MGRTSSRDTHINRGMKKLVKESIDFERGTDPKRSLEIGKDRYKKPGDIEVGENFLYRRRDLDNYGVIINTLNGRTHEVPLFAAKDIINALRNLMD
jgi:hypothetical protein